MEQQQEQQQEQPLIMRVGTRKTVWINIVEVCNSYNIPLDVMLERVATRFQKPYRLDGNRLIIDAVLKAERFNSLIV
jgi:hypothetical protein